MTSPALRPVLWGLFCTCSWTWCIGMYLPLLLLDRFGWPGVIAFALPNVAGCALFGYVLDRRRSREICLRHATAMRLFSVVTVAYHVYFAGYVTMCLVPAEWRHPWLAAGAAAGVLVAGLILSTGRSTWWLAAAVAVFGLSLATGATLWPQSGPLPGSPDGVAMADLASLAPVIAGGFLLCPYLDPTFHRALQESPSRHAFLVFGMTFALMLVVSCLYWRAGTILMTPLVLSHLCAQGLFSVAAHLREIRGSGREEGDQGQGHGHGHGHGWRGLLLLAPALAIPLAMAPALSSDPAGAGRDIFVRFLVFYGLVFPAYVFVFIGPARPLALRRGAMFALALAVVVLAPLYEIGFIGPSAWALLIPVGLGLAWWMVRGRHERTCTVSAERAGRPTRRTGAS